MTRKDYELLAKALNDTKAHQDDPQRLDQWEWTCHVMAANLRTTNPNFDRARFLKACGIEEG